MKKNTKINKNVLKLHILLSVCVSLFLACVDSAHLPPKSKPPIAYFLGVDADGQAHFILKKPTYEGTYYSDEYGYGVVAGIVYANNPNVTIEKGTTAPILYINHENGSLAVSFPTIPKTSYYWRSYAKDSLGGVIYGEENSFTTETEGI